MTTILQTRSTSWGSSFELAYASPIVTSNVLKSMGASRASLDRHNRKRQRPRALNDESGKLGNDGRRRRLNGSSDDEGRIAEDGFSNEDLRVGGPYLCAIPFESRPLPTTNPLHLLLQHKVGGDTLFRRINGIVRNRGIELLTAGPWDVAITLSWHKSKWHPEPQPIPTITILAKRYVVDEVWLNTAREIYSLLPEKFRHVSVEIVDPQALRPPITLPVLKSDPMFNKWDSVLSRILTGVKDKKDILFIGCYRRGRNVGSDNPVTVLMIVDVNSEKNWRGTRDVITRILSDMKLPLVAVEIVKDRRALHNDVDQETGFKEGLSHGRALAGEPIAHRDNDTGSGTLGGFIELQGPSTGKWQCFALTCFHVIDPRDQDISDQGREAVRECRSSGFKPGAMSIAELSEARRWLTASHPSLRAKEEQITKLQAQIAEYKSFEHYEFGLMLKDNDLYDTELSQVKKTRWEKTHSDILGFESQIERIERFFRNSDNVLGYVSSASGYKLTGRRTLDGEQYYPTILDWALIKVDVEKRNPSNKFGDDLVMQHIASSGKFSRLDANDYVLEFRGYRSGLRKVKYNGLRVANVARGQETLEYSVVGIGNKAAVVHGDSGSLLYQPGTNEVLGMVIAGFENQQIARFTRIDALVKDITEHTGATDIRILGE